MFVRIGPIAKKSTSYLTMPQNLTRHKPLYHIKGWYTHCSDTYFCDQGPVTIFVKSGPGNCWLLDGNADLWILCFLAFACDQFHKKCLWKYSLTSVRSFHIKNYYHISKGTMCPATIATPRIWQYHTWFPCSLVSLYAWLALKGMEWIFYEHYSVGIMKEKMCCLNHL